MASITFAVDDELKSRLSNFPWINWSELAREEFISNMKRQEALQELDKLLKNSKLTDKDILRLSKKVRKGRFKEIKSKGLV